MPGGGPILGAWPEVPLTEVPLTEAWPRPWSAVAAAIRAGVQNAAAARMAAVLTACTAPGVWPGAGTPAWRDGRVADGADGADGAAGSTIAAASATAAAWNGVENFRGLSALRHQMTACPLGRRTDTFYC